MKYMGSKSRITKDLAPIIQKVIDDNLISCYIEPFVGGSNMIEKINCNKKIGSDSNNYLIELSVRNVLKQIENLKDVYYFHKDFNEYYDKNNELETAERFLFYCDPPYESTTKYKDDFNHEKYWEWVRNMSKKHIVLCSEYNAPADFKCIWSKDINVDLNCNRKSNDEGNKRTEKLFVLKG